MGLLTSGTDGMVATEARLNVLIAQRSADNAEAVGNVVRGYEPNAQLIGQTDFRIYTINPFDNAIARLLRATSWQVGDVRLFFVSGVLSADAGSRIWQGYTEGGVFEINTGENTGLEAWSLLAYPLLINGTGPGVNRDVWVGHSAGGTSLYYLGKRHTGIYQQIANLQNFAIGSPKAARFRQWDANVKGTWRHLFNDDDPVPFIPPQLTDWERFWAGMSMFEARAIMGYSFIPGGKQLDVLGNVSYRNAPSNIGPSPPAAVGAWLNAVQSSRTTSHSLESYLARVRLYNAANNPPAPIPAQAIIVQRERIPPAVQIERAIDAAQASVVSNTTRNVGETQTVIPSVALFKAFRRGRLWYVSFRGQQIALAPNKKRARGLARTGNDFLRRLMIEHEVSGNILTTQLANWIIEAASDNGDYFPVLNNVG